MSLMLVGIVVSTWESMWISAISILVDPWSARDWRLNDFFEPSLSLKLGSSTCAHALMPFQNTFCILVILAWSISLSLAHSTQGKVSCMVMHVTCMMFHGMHGATFKVLEAMHYHAWIMHANLEWGHWINYV